MLKKYLLLNKKQIDLEDTIFLPVGSIEGHGNFLPVGTDAIIAEGFANVFAKETEGVILPPIWYGITPNTNNLGAVSVRHKVLINALKDICCNLYSSGFTKIIIVNIHNGNDASIKVVVEKLFLEKNLVVYYLNPYTFINNETSRMFVDNSEKETALYLAACKELDIKLYMKSPKINTYSPRKEELAKLRKYGYIGFEYETEKQHIDERIDPPLVRAIEYLNIAKNKVKEIVEELDRYITSKNK